MQGWLSGSWVSPFKFLDAPVRVHLGWMLIAGLIGWSLAMGSLPVVYAGLSDQTYRAMAAIIIVGLGLSVLLQAFAHTVVGRAMGLSVDRITLFVFGGVAELREEPRTALSELGMALVGPILSTALCGVVAFMAGAARAAGASDLIVGSLTFVATLNLVMALFNLLPVYPLDGGRAARAVLWMTTGHLGRATRIATHLGLVFSVLVMAAGAVQAVAVSLEGGLWTVLIGLFLQYAARSARDDVAAVASTPSSELERGVAARRNDRRDARRRSLIAKREERRGFNVRHSAALPGSG